jgi:cytochrome P450
MSAPISAPWPPGPRGRFITGTSARWRTDILEFMQSMVRQHGPAVRFHYALGQHGFLFTHPSHYRRILQDNQRNYSKGHRIYDVLRVVAGRGVFTSDGDHWRAHRRLMQPAFHENALGALDRIIVQRTNAMLDLWDRDVETAAGGMVEVNHAMMALTLGIVGDSLFGHSMTPHTATVGDGFSVFNRELMSIVTRPLTWLTGGHRFTPAGRRLHEAAESLKRVADQIIAARSTATEGEPQDLLGMLMAATDADTGKGLTHAELRDEILTLMLAGHETSATALTWTLHLLGEHTEVEQRICAELQEVIGERTPDMGDVRRLSYTRAVVQESMRLYPPVYSFSRRAEQADVIGGYRVPAGAAISLSPYVTHRMPEFWDAPEVFRPERFLPPAPPPGRFSYIPFSDGPRGCIGQGFAMTEMVLILALILPRYRLRPQAGRAVIPQPAVTLRPAGGLPMLRMRVR